MEEKKQKPFQWIRWAAAWGIGVLGVGLLTDAPSVSEGVRRGLEVCGAVLIPSLFPFMVLASFLSLTDYARLLSVPLNPVTTRVFKLPKELGIVVLLSLIGGYPVGAKMIASLLDQERIDRATAQRMLCFCVNSGPSFLIAAVGMGMFHSKTAGLVLFGTQTAATLLIGWLVSLGVPAPRGKSRPGPNQKTSTALVMAVQSATSGMLAMCAFAILFSGLLSLVTARGVASAVAAVLPVSEAGVVAVISGLFEVTSGCIAAAEVGGMAAFGLASAILSFSGLSVLFQIFSCFGSQPVNFRPLVTSRLGHAVLSTAMALPFYGKISAELPVWLAANPPAYELDGHTSLISVCLLGMCAIFTLSIGKEIHTRRNERKK